MHKNTISYCAQLDKTKTTYKYEKHYSGNRTLPCRKPNTTRSRGGVGFEEALIKLVRNPIKMHMENIQGWIELAYREDTPDYTNYLKVLELI